MQTILYIMFEVALNITEKYDTMFKFLYKINLSFIKHVVMV
jgi:hypothetical protein